MVPQLTMLLRFAGSTGCCRMISCRSLAGCLRKIRDKGLMKHPHSPGVEHRIHTDNLLTHSCPPPFFCPGLHNHGCNICVPIHTDAGRKTPCRTPDKSLTTLFSSFPALDECCSILTGIPVSRTFSACLYDSVQWLYRTEDRRKTPCPLSSQPCNLPSALTPFSFFAVSSAVS